MLFGVQSKNYKEIDMKILKSFLSKNKSKFIQPRLREYDNFRKLIYNFMKKKYKYVSYVFGGFEKIHEESMRYNIPLLNHDDNCFLCKKKNSKISELLKEKEVKKPNTARSFFFGRKESDANKNKEAIKKINDNNSNNNDANRNRNSSKNKTGVSDNIVFVNNPNNNLNNNKEKKEGFFSKLFGKNNNKNKNEANADSQRKISNNGNIDFIFLKMHLLFI